MRRHGADRIQFINCLPEAHQRAFILTHDVEGPAALERIEPPLDLNHRYGLISGSDLEPEDYEIPPETFELTDSAGCAVGVHQLMHAGMRLRGRDKLETQLRGIHLYIEAWGPGAAA